MPLPFGGAFLPLIGAGIDALFGKSQADANAASQKEFAQHGIRWRVKDAEAAGIHPLYALGAQTHSFAPTMVGSNFAAAGQDISRAIDATRTGGERLNARLGELALERAGLENDLLRAQIAGSKAALLRQVGPPMADPLTETVMGGHPIKPNPGWSDAQDIQNRYGEPAEWLYFPFVAGADAWQNLPDQIKSGFGKGAEPFVQDPGGFVFPY